MSNYINVLRRLERERRVTPASAPVPLPNAPSVRRAEPEVTVANVVPVRVSNPAPASIDPPPVAAAPRPVVALPTAPALPPEPAPVSPVVAPASVAAPAPVAAPASMPAPVAHETPSARRFEHVRSRALASTAHPGIASLLDNIRLLATGRAVRIVVFAGASTVEAVDALAGGLAEHANANGMKAIVAALTGTAGRSYVTPVTGFDDRSALEVELDTKVSPSQLHDWLGKTSPGSELLVICAPPLATSIDGALLACACDGLVIVAESEVTERAALQTAAERARVTGCRTLGVVMHGAKNRIPAWIRKLAGDTSGSPSVRED